MLTLFYHVPRIGSGSWLRQLVSVVLVSSALATGCSRPATPSPTPSSPALPSTGATVAAPSSESTPTATAIAKGREIMESVRTAAGGAMLTALRSFELGGTSTMSGVKVSRRLTVLAKFPQFYRQDEGPMPGGRGTRLHTIIGLDGGEGWMRGALLGGDGQSKDRAVAQRAYTRAARQTMTGFLAGINLPWLVDSALFTVTDAGALTSGPDSGALQVLIDGPDGRVGRLLIDPGTHLPRRLIQPPQGGGGGSAAVADIVFTYSDFQPHSGLQLPRTITRENGNNRTVWAITDYRLNPKLLPVRFRAGQR